MGSKLKGFAFTWFGVRGSALNSLAAKQIKLSIPLRTISLSWLGSCEFRSLGYRTRQRQAPGQIKGQDVIPLSSAPPPPSKRTVYMCRLASNPSTQSQFLGPFARSILLRFATNIFHILFTSPAQWSSYVTLQEKLLKLECEPFAKLRLPFRELSPAVFCIMRRVLLNIAPWVFRGSPCVSSGMGRTWNLLLLPTPS